MPTAHDVIHAPCGRAASASEAVLRDELNRIKMELDAMRAARDLDHRRLIEQDKELETVRARNRALAAELREAIDERDRRSVR